MSRSSSRLVPVTAVLLHLAFIGLALRESLVVPGEDFASYYNAVQVSLAGGSPYDNEALSALGNPVHEGYPVHPFIYPPTALPLLGWLAWLPVGAAWALFATVVELAALASLGAWVLLWRGLHPRMSGFLALLFALVPAVWLNLQKGQVNWLVLALAFVGVLLALRRREILGGALLGAATMLKLSPALLVLWFLRRGRLRVVGGAAVAGCLLVLATLAMLDLGEQLRFYADVLPTLSDGRYHGLTVPLTTFDSYAPAGQLARIWPAAEGLSGPARVGVSLVNLALLGGTAWAAWREPTDGWQRAGQLAAVAGASALVPVFVFDHHLIWLLPAAGLVLAGLVAGRLGRAWWLPAGLGLFALLVPLSFFRPDDLVSRSLLQAALQLAQIAGLYGLVVCAWALAGSRAVDASGPLV